MQELLFPHQVEFVDDPFDGYHVISHMLIDQSHVVCLFGKSDPNGKKRYLVGERLKVSSPGEPRWELLNVKEHKHTEYRALDDYYERIQDLATG